VDLIQHSGEVLILVRVVPPNACPATVLSAREYLHTRAAELEDAGLHVITRVLCGEPAAGPKILVPLDGSRWSEGAVPVAHAFAHQLHGELLLVEAVQLPDLAQEVAAMVPMDVTGDLEALSAEATAYLEDIAELLRAREGLSRIVLGSVTSACCTMATRRSSLSRHWANHQSTATRHDDDSIGSTRWA
jgi:nucleotide-binding universal stress UspA family protein